MTIMLRRFPLVLAIVALLPASARAVDPARRISQLAHAAWRIQDGFFNGSPGIMAQTQDGYLWLGTSSGLLRFDGVRFVPWTAEHGARLPSSRIQALRAARDGSLWIGTGGGLSQWKNGTLIHYRTGSAGGVGEILEDRDGRIWITQTMPSAGSGPVCQVVELDLRCFGDSDGVPAYQGAFTLTQDSHGGLWIGGRSTLVRWTSASHSVYEPDGLKNNLASGIDALAAVPDGSIWVGIAKAGPGLGLQHFVDGRWHSVKTPELDGDALLVTALYRDADGALWMGTGDRGLYRLYRDNVDHFDSRNGLSNDFVQSVGGDREGNVWVVTNQGVDRFSDTTVVSFSSTEGLCSTEVDTVLASRDGAVWVGGDSALSSLRNGRVSCIRTGKGLPGTQVTSLLDDHAGRLWVGIDDGLWIYEAGVFRRITRTDGRPVGFVTGITEDAQNRVWVVVSGPPRAVLRIEDEHAREEFHDQQPRRLATDPTGGLWLGLLNGDLAVYRDGEVKTYRFAHDESALLYQILSDRDGSVLAATSYGLIGWRQGKQFTLTTANGLPCPSVYAMAFDDHGSLWLFMDCGLGALTSADLQTWKTTPDQHVSIRTLDVFDGVRSGGASFSGGAHSSDGRLWFATGAVLQTLDPDHLRRNAVPPPVQIERIVADRTTYAVAGVVRLPPRTRDLEIDYVGLSFAVPQRVTFRYRLDGRDDAWQEPGTRRQAFYSDLPPGSYRFRVIASNNHGVWNEEGAALELAVAPAWYQTYAFMVLLAVSGAVGVWALYRLRIRQVARSLSTRFDERLAERTRMARDLHDTLLQTVQGSKMVADNALDRPDDALGMRRAMEQVSIWLGQASTEGRAAVNALRASTRERNDLAEAFRRAIEDCRRQGSVQASLSVSGDAKEMHPVVRDEVYRIGYEAIRNACTHSGGSRLEVELTYARDLIVRVSDNGVGIDPAFASDGREGHFGLQGMRERAARIGATLTVVPSAASGTEIRVTVPGRVIFSEPAASLFDRMRAHFTK
jgi:signal transduction histidine kinase/ligand-binding sensor domain-containing protein